MYAGGAFSYVRHGRNCGVLPSDRRKTPHFGHVRRSRSAWAPSGEDLIGGQGIGLVHRCPTGKSRCAPDRRSLSGWPSLREGRCHKRKLVAGPHRRRNCGPSHTDGGTMRRGHIDAGTVGRGTRTVRPCDGGTPTPGLLISLRSPGMLGRGAGSRRAIMRGAMSGPRRRISLSDTRENARFSAIFGDFGGRGRLSARALPNAKELRATGRQ